MFPFVRFDGEYFASMAIPAWSMDIFKADATGERQMGRVWRT